jgi:hypothetical protein
MWGTEAVMNRETFVTLNKTRLFTADQVVDIVQSDREKVLDEFLHKPRKKADHDDKGICPYDSCVLCEIKGELRQQEGEP